MRRALPFLAFCMAGGCGALLGIEPGSPEPETNDGSTTIDVDKVNAADTGSDSTIVDGPPADSGPPGIDCLGAQRDAFFCDGFESTALNAAWTPILSFNSATFASTTQYVAKGARGGLSRFQPIPDGGTARIAWKRPGGAGPIAFQFALYVMSDAWSAGQDVPVGGLRSGGSSILVYFLPNGNDANGDLQIRFNTGAAVAPIALGASKLNAWQCIELVHDGAGFTVYVGGDTKGTAAVPVTFDTAEVGFDWPYTGNTNAAKSFAYDNVAIGPARLGCIAD